MRSPVRATCLTVNDRLRLARAKGKALAQPFLMPDYGNPYALAPYTCDLECGLRVILTVDKGHWFPNEDWQNCIHLSVSQAGESEPDRELEAAVVAAVFGPRQDMICLEHRPGSRVRHWRLFFTDDGEYLIPKGEMYSRQGAASYFRAREKAKARQHRADFEEEGEG